MIDHLVCGHCGGRLPDPSVLGPFNACYEPGQGSATLMPCHRCNGWNEVPLDEYQRVRRAQRSALKTAEMRRRQALGWRECEREDIDRLSYLGRISRRRRRRIVRDLAARGLV
jgi:hypothetical protein